MTLKIKILFVFVIRLNMYILFLDFYTLYKMSLMKIIINIQLLLLLKGTRFIHNGKFNNMYINK